MAFVVIAVVSDAVVAAVINPHAAVGHLVGEEEFLLFVLSSQPFSSLQGPCWTFPLPPLLSLMLLSKAEGGCCSQGAL